MRILGAAILAICPMLFGFLCAKNLIRIKNDLSQIVSFLERCKSEIRYQGREVADILEHLREDRQFVNLTFLPECCKNMKTLPFPQAWEKGVADWKSGISQEDRKRLSSLSDVLGASDVEGQLNMLGLLEEDFQRSYLRQETLTTTKGKMFRTLGILGGIGLGILIV